MEELGLLSFSPGLHILLSQSHSTWTAGTVAVWVCVRVCVRVCTWKWGLLMEFSVLKERVRKA